MKSISRYIEHKMFESAKGDTQGELILKMFKGVQTSRDNITEYLSKLEMNELKDISKYINSKDSRNYVAFMPNDDEFINAANKPSIVDKISQYVHKYVCNVA